MALYAACHSRRLATARSRLAERRSPLPFLRSPTPERRARILVIDDEVKIGAVITQILSERHDVVAVQDAKVAFDLLDGGQAFDVVLCDLMMPNIGGREVFDAFSRWPALLPGLIFMTGGTFSEEATAFLERARRPVIYKPFAATELEAMVDAHLNDLPNRAS